MMENWCLIVSTLADVGDGITTHTKNWHKMSVFLLIKKNILKKRRRIKKGGKAAMVYSLEG